ncbi:MAG: efflux RND transporter periplasmic adaptor subunit [Bacteroidales bacterium]|nr:efflux RND transporter periplasmic adaptor subunit [Bacteroidales bacterium]
MKKILTNILFIALISSLFSCKFQNGNAADNSEKRQYQDEKNIVDVIVLKKAVFNKELVSNGKLKAFQKSILKFETSERLTELYVKNGSWVKKGSIIASANKIKAQQKLDQAILQFKKANLTRQELLIGQGFEVDSASKIPKDILEIANIRSGYSSSENELNVARYNYNTLTLIAPFSGIIANLKCKIHENVNSGEEFCSLIDDSKFEVEFSLIEKELQQIKIKQAVKIHSFSSGKIYSGFVNEINPVVEENGMVKIKALISNSGDLMEGMNVEVIIENKIPNQMVVPKSAVVLRQNKEVLFRYINGKAFWTYVKTEFENSNSYTINANIDRGAEINVGDTIIISGNLNLAHDSEVEIGN